MRVGVEKLVWFILVWLVTMFILIQQDIFNTTQSTTVGGRKSKDHKQKIEEKRVILNARPMGLFVKQLARAQRFERNNDLREIMKDITTKLCKISRNQYARKKNSTLHDVTLLLNTLQEIQDVGGVLKDLEQKSSLEWVRSVSIVIGLTNSTLRMSSDRLLKLKSKLPNLQWTIQQAHATDKLSKTLNNLILSSVNTKFVLISRNLQHIMENFDMEMFIRPLSRNTCDLIGGSSIYPDGTWNLGCYQSKLIWNQYKAQNGFDAMYGKNWMRCDTIDGPFVTHTALMLDFLKTRPNIEDYLLYTELFYIMNNQNKIMLVHPSSVFHTHDTRDWLKLSRDQWSTFVQRQSLGDIISETHHYEFGYIEAKSRCINKANMLRPRPCMRKLHFTLIKSYKLFHKYALEYTNEDGSGLAAVKLGTSLPWDLDQDFAFQSNNFTELLKHENEFRKHGIKLNKNLNKPCMKNATKGWGCGYIGFADGLWRIECWGQYLLMSDYYRPQKVPDKFKGEMFPTRILTDPTLVDMGDCWTVNRPNPGQYARQRYGTDILRHAKHWMQGGAKSSMGIYATNTRFSACAEEGHHQCMNQYLADGNIQFQRVWA